MRVCLVSLDYKPHRSSGLTIYAEDLARGLNELGVTVTVLAAHRPGLPAHHHVAGIELYRIPIHPFDWISYSWRAAGLLSGFEREKSFDIVHFLDIHFAYAYRHPFVASLWQSFRQRLTAHMGQPYHTGKLDLLRREIYYRLARHYMESPSLSRAGRLIASCCTTRQEFIANYHISPDRIDLVPQGIDSDFFRHVPTADIRRRLKLNGYRILLFVGFITPRKGLEYLAQALHLLPGDVHLLIAGRWEPAYRERFIDALGMARGRLHELGYLSDEERPAYYSLADVYVSPSLLEGLGITPIEALACGTPAIVTSASSGPEEVGDAGLVVPPCDPQALAQAISLLLENEDLRRELAQRGRERVLRYFSYRRMAELTLQSYRTYLNGAGG